MAKNKRTFSQREHDLLFVANSILEGKGPTEITVELNDRNKYDLCRQQVSYDIRTIWKEWQTERLKNLDGWKTRQVAILMKIEREAWEAWELSKDPEVSRETGSTSAVISAKTGAIAVLPAEKVTTRENEVGDPKFLQVVIKCEERISQILGIDEQPNTSLNKVIQVILHSDSGRDLLPEPEPGNL